MSISRLEYAGKLAGVQNSALQLNQRAIGQVMAIREGGLLDVSIGGRSYQAFSTIPAKPGDTLQLRLASLHPQPIFTVVEPEESSTSSTGVKLDLSAFSTSTSRSFSINSGLAGLYHLLEQLPSQASGRVAVEIQRLLQVLEQYSIDTRDLHYSARVKQQALSSGMFLESMIAAGYPAALLMDDIKTQLYKTLRRLQPNRTLQLRDGKVIFAPLNPGNPSPIQGKAPAMDTPHIPVGQVLQLYMDQQEPDERIVKAGKVLGQNLENTLTQLVTKQLEVVEYQQQNKNIWLLDLLVRKNDDTLTIPVTIGCHLLAGEEIWAVSFTLDLPGTGKIQIDMHINNKAVDLNLVNERQHTQDTLLRARPALLNKLRNAGLSLESMSSSLESPP